MTENFGRIIAEQVQRITWQERVQWERTLQLRIRTRPRWMPLMLWGRILTLVLNQTEKWENVDD